MSLATLIVALVAVGVILYVINQLVPMEPRIKTILNVVVILVLVVWLLDVFGLIDAFNDVKVRRAK